MPSLALTVGERVTLLHLLSFFGNPQNPERTSSTMRKTKRIKHSIQFSDLPENATDRELLDLGEATIECSLDSETLGWLWDTFQKYNRWPTQLDEWIDTLEDKLRAALAEKSKSA